MTGEPEQAPERLKPLKLTAMAPPRFSFSDVECALSADCTSLQTCEKVAPVAGGWAEDIGCALALVGATDAGVEGRDTLWPCGPVSAEVALAVVALTCTETACE